MLGDFNSENLSYNWEFRVPNLNALHTKVSKAIQLGLVEGASRRSIFEKVWILAHNACDESAPSLPEKRNGSVYIPAMSEPWYCCAEPSNTQLSGV